MYALLADGSTVEIRPAGPTDFDAVRAMHAAMSPDNLYLRFFNLGKHAAEIEARRLCRDPRPGHAALLALAGGEVVGCASYDAGESGAAMPGTAVPGVAEVAFAVADHMHHRGIATLLLEHLVSSARGEAVTIFTAETLSENKAMLRVFADAGLPVQRRYADGVAEMTFPIPGDDGSTALEVYLNAVAERERRAAAASLRHVLAPESVVIIGASREPGTVGRAILDNIRAGGYAGRLYAVNARARQIGGQPCLPSVRDLPEPADLAVIAVPAGAVLDAAEQCGQRGVRSLVVVTSGLDAAACADLLATCRRHGMRLADFTAPGGTEVVVRVEDDHVFGPLVVFGLGGAATEVLADRAARLTPLTDVDAEQLIHSIRAAPLLLGQHGSAGVDVGALRDLLLRVSRLADDLPEVIELDLNPVIARADGAFVAHAQIRATPYQPQDPFLRRLR